MAAVSVSVGSPAWHWDQLCGRHTNFTIWDQRQGDFGQCFEQLVFSCTSHAFLLVVSVYHFGRHTGLRVPGPLPPSWTLHVRLIMSVLLMLTPIFFLVLTPTILQHHLSLMDIISGCLKIFSWLAHSGFVFRHHRFYHLHIRGPVILVISVLLTTAAMIIQFRTVILHARSQTLYLNRVEEYATFVTLAFHFLYLCTLIPYKRPPLLAQNQLSIQSSDDETSTLLGSERLTYGSVGTQHSEELGLAEDGANCLSKLSFWWVQPLMLKGKQGKLNTANDMFQLPKKLNTYDLEQTFGEVFNRRTKISQQYPKNNDYMNNTSENDDALEENNDSALENLYKPMTLMSALNKTFGCEYYSLGILKLLADMIGFAGPVLLNLLVTFMESKTEPVWKGYLYAGGLFLSTFLVAMFSTHFDYQMNVIGFKVRAALITTVYRKAMTVNSVALSKFSSGEVVNFMSTDTDRIINFCPSFHQFWSLPFQIAISLWLLHQQVGLAFLAGIGFAVLLIPINRWLAVKIGELSNTMMTQKDSRVKVMNEILYGIRVIKFYAWEHHFSERVDVIRQAELRSLKVRKYLDAMCVYFWATTPVLISILTFMTYVLMGNHLTAAKVFTSLALFNMLISPLNAFPWVINGLVEAWVSVKRLQAFLLLQDLDWQCYYSQQQQMDASLDIRVQDGHFSWKSKVGCQVENGNHLVTQVELPEEELEGATNNATGTMQLTGINLSIKKGSLVGVVGGVGSGKSSVLSAILAEMYRVSGHVTVADLSGGFGLAAQEPWVQHASLRDNILFGLPLDEAWYQQVVDVCALREDLKMLPGGDQTEIGENGVTLSGGQKARVALARAVYQDKLVYLLDDPLAAVDAHVAQHLFSQCIMGALAGKTRILCTHHTSYLTHADVVVVFEDGKITKSGPPDEILSELDLKSPQKEKNPQKDKTEAGDVGKMCEPLDGEGGALVQEEEKETGTVRLEVYKAYWTAVGACLSPLVLLSLFLMQASRNVSDWWLSFWVTHSHDNSSFHGNQTLDLTQSAISTTFQQYSYSVSLGDMSSSGSSKLSVPDGDDVQYYLTVYGILAAANSAFTLARAFLFAYGGICAATVLHQQLLNSILKAPISFFDVTPIGRIINRFSSDLYIIDDSLPFTLNILLALLYGMLGTIAITCYGLPWFTILLVPLGAVYYYIQRFYRQTSRELKRISSVNLSPIYAHFSESITGLVTIRALRHTQRFCGENRRRLEENQRAEYCSKVAAQWLNIRLQMIGVAMVTAVAFIAVLEHHFHSINPGLVGLAISYALSVTNLLGSVLMFFTETEKMMVSVERAGQYIHEVPQEKEDSMLSVPPFWPIQGAVTFQRVCLRYREGLPYALHNVCFETQPAEKVGIVGRTGSGKSSLFLSLFQMVNVESGQILIDGINVRHLNLKQLRSRLAIIPQDPFLFSGSVRDNLDPVGCYTDRDLWAVLQRCHLKDAVVRLGGLESEVAERGRHFSVGQRQLMCLARALLTRAKVLCIDEATASVDQMTDALIQQTLKEEFSNHTVLTIAHRINTVLDCDRVLVMNAGKLVEFEPPHLLLANSNSLFYGLVHGKRLVQT